MLSLINCGSPVVITACAAVFVMPEHRRKGIGSRLVERVMHEAGVLGVSTLHLFTPDMMPFYVELGWTIIERSHYRGEDICIMSVDLPQE